MILISPSIWKEKTIIIIPATILNSYEFCNSTWPKKVEAAPNIIKTIENPTVNKIIGIKLMFFFSIYSFNELPDMYEIYPGIKGNTHGDKKLINPAPKAIINSNIIL